MNLQNTLADIPIEEIQLLAMYGLAAFFLAILILLRKHRKKKMIKTEDQK